MRQDWESGLRGRIYALGRRLTPLSWRRALRRRVPAERLLGLRKPAVEHAWTDLAPGSRPPGPRGRRRAARDRLELPAPAAAAARGGPRPPRAPCLLRVGPGLRRAARAGGRGPRRHACCRSRARAARTCRRGASPAGRSPAPSTSLAAAHERFGLGRAALLVQSPFWAPLASALKEAFGWRVLYDCLDAHEAFATNRPAVLAAAERELAPDRGPRRRDLRDAPAPDGGLERVLSPPPQRLRLRALRPGRAAARGSAADGRLRGSRRRMVRRRAARPPRGAVPGLALRDRRRPRGPRGPGSPGRAPTSFSTGSGRTPRCRPSVPGSTSRSSRSGSRR